MMGVVDEIAAYIEIQPFCPTDIVYTVTSVDPRPGTEPLTLAITSVSGDEAYLPGEGLMRIQLLGRGVGAFSALNACYHGLEGTEVLLPDSGTWVTFVALQSTANLIGDEDDGGEMCSLNMQVDYGSPS